MSLNGINFNLDGYQNWKNYVAHLTLYQHFFNKVKQQNAPLQQKIRQIQSHKEHSEEQKLEYFQLIKQCFSNIKSIDQSINDNLNNKEMLEQLYKDKNINISFESWNNWIKTGKPILKNEIFN